MNRALAGFVPGKGRQSVSGGAYPVDHVCMRGVTMNRTFFPVLVVVVAGMMAVRAQATPFRWCTTIPQAR